MVNKDFHKWICYWLCKYHAIMFEQHCSFKNNLVSKTMIQLHLIFHGICLPEQPAGGHFRGQFGDGSTPKFVHYILVYLCTKIGAFIKKCTIGLNILGKPPHYTLSSFLRSRFERMFWGDWGKPTKPASAQLAAELPHSVSIIIIAPWSYMMMWQIQDGGRPPS